MANIGARVLKVSKPDKITGTVLKEWLEWHKEEVKRYEELKRYYLGEHSIGSRSVRIKNNANNKVTVNFCEFITNTLSAYFMSKTVGYKADESTEKILKGLNRLNVSDEHDFELAKSMGIYGHGFEVLYYDASGNVRFEQLLPENTFMVYDADELGERKIYAVRYLVKGSSAKKTYTVSVYDDVNLTTYVLDGKMSIVSTDENQHLYNGIPVVEYKNNDERTGDFESIISLQDAYNILSSDRVNNVENVVNSLLVLVNYNMDEEETSDLVRTLKKHGILTTDEHGDAKYISNSIDAGMVEQLRNDIREDIFTISCCPNMSDEKFSGNSSGIAIKFKMWNTEQKTGIKEKKFKRALTEKWYLISKTPLLTGFNVMSIDMVFDRNLPTNAVEAVEIAKNVFGTISERSYLEFVGKHIGIEDIDEEIKLISEERETELDKII
ncbi:MAG: phage portal protein [Cetobacterium sp.]|uniref:phage portal protein n=1 Tax=Cetobacterium sp. TaxID=2071632 RepID=UPI003F2E25DE